MLNIVVTMGQAFGRPASHIYVPGFKFYTRSLTGTERGSADGSSSWVSVVDLGDLEFWALHFSLAQLQLVCWAKFWFYRWCINLAFVFTAESLAQEVTVPLERGSAIVDLTDFGSGRPSSVSPLLSLSNHLY